MCDFDTVPCFGISPFHGAEIRVTGTNRACVQRDCRLLKGILLFVAVFCCALLASKQVLFASKKQKCPNNTSLYHEQSVRNRQYKSTTKLPFTHLTKIARCGPSSKIYRLALPGSSIYSKN